MFYGQEEGGTWSRKTGMVGKMEVKPGCLTGRFLLLKWSGPDGCDGLGCLLLDQALGLGLVLLVLGNKNIKGPFILLVKIPHGPIL